MRHLIVEAGGTKSNLAIVENGQIREIKTSVGVNFTRDHADEKFSYWKSAIDDYSFENIIVFAAGAEADTSKVKLEAKNHFQFVNFELHSDMLAACFATKQKQHCIVAILGTGSNACVFDGNVVIKNVAPGGFILGDEGSGAHLGKTLLIHYLRKSLSKEIIEKLEEKLLFSDSFVVENVYKKSIHQSVEFMASCTHFIAEYKTDQSVKEVIDSSFNLFADYVVKNYSAYSNRLYTVGSVGSVFFDELNMILKNRGIDYIENIQYPIQNLCEYIIEERNL